ncbi:hypothetical protein BX070DRAFT_251430 [Coemansia spiralis]|nr:hypothetical protein BX070DRAFT_251430 [Coemansia spiralis]
MACDLEDPKIAEAYSRILSCDDIDWMVIGYGSSRDQLTLYTSGGGGIAEMSASVPDEVVFGFIVFEGAKVLIIHVSEKVSGVRRARALAHQTAIAEFFNQHDVVVNTSKPSDLSPIVLRNKTRHLAVKSAPMLAGNLGRSDSVQHGKLKPTVWRQRSQESSRASTPSAQSPNAAEHLAPVSVFIKTEPPEIPEEPAPGSDTATDGASMAYTSTPVEPTAQGLAILHHSINAQHYPSGLGDGEGNNAGINARASGQPQSAPPVVPGHYKETTTAQLHPVTGPPTPSSFSEPSKRRSVSANHVFEEAKLELEANRSPRHPSIAASATAAVQSGSTAPVSFCSEGSVEEFLQMDSPIITHFDYQAHQGELSPTFAQKFIAYSPQKSIGVNLASPTSTVSSAAAAAAASTNRYSSIRSRERPTSASTAITNGRRNRASVFSSSFSPVQPEVASMLSQISEHRKETAELAENTGVMSEKYFECLQGYTSIQEPTNAFWKRRYFVVAENTLFLYTNECSRVPTDYLDMASVVRPPRDAEDEVLMPHSIALDFGEGEYYMYFDSAKTQRSFIREVSKIMNSS